MEHEEVSGLISEHQKDIGMVIASEDNVVFPIASAELSCNSVCSFSRQGYNTMGTEERSKSGTKLGGLIVFCLIVMAVEVVGGMEANSLAVITDAVHLLADVAGFFISLLALRASGWEATPHQSFGYSRFEVLGTLLSVQLIWLICGVLTYEAIDRIVNKNAGVNGRLMFGTAAFGFVVNLIMVIWMGHDHSHHSCHDHGHLHHHEGELEHSCAMTEQEKSTLVSGHVVEEKQVSNINIQGAYLHVVVDLIQSVGVMIAGALIWANPDWLIADLLCTLGFSVLVLGSTLPMLRDVFSILMERTPREINVGKLESDIKCISGVEDIHDLHVWSITRGKLVLSCHVNAEAEASSSQILNRIRDHCEKEYRIHHVTVQIEQ
ncbi:hypothetical protein Tsubulata_004321 [Turnera subulata]|uniref:Cation efflux protein cytoplasmic domain-containing protein n=1 Tax=Turnera subulata TaxID=218843 RepID=A0A9Q0FMG8_9ROSI|nr:hypothetical protein Tsubulata_004321 [Turnera subulata]